MKLCSTLRHYNKANLPHDIVAGLIIAAISIPISMGYAQMSGLPAVYGLYGSLIPILCFAIFSTSPQMIFGVDAAPAALVGGVLVNLGVTAGSEEAIQLVPVITFFTAIWLLIFSLIKAGKLVKYISEPVMGGFISGIGITIITMQLPKLVGGTSGHGEFFELAFHFIKSCASINWPSLALGAGTLAIILISKKVSPKFPMAVVAMVVGAAAQAIFHLDAYGVAMLPAVDPGLPHLAFPDFNVIVQTSLPMGQALTIALVIMAETLLGSNNFATKNGYRLDDNQEILAYSIGNFAAAFSGSCPTNGSVSRMVMGEQFGGKSQVMGIVAGLAMILVLLFATPFIAFLPVPVLTAIVISALIGVLEFDLAAQLHSIDRGEFWIFIGAFLGVLALGTVYGVVIGVVLSFGALLNEATNPPRQVMGVIPGHHRFYSIKRNKNAHPIQGVVIYRFSSNLFFANIGVFEDEIMDLIKPDTRVVIVYASGIGSLDLTAAKHINRMYHNFKDQGIRFYFTEHIGTVNDQLRAYGFSDLLEAGFARRLTNMALLDAGYKRPYPLEGEEKDLPDLKNLKTNQMVNEFQWAFGAEAEAKMEKHTQSILDHINPDSNIDQTLESALKNGLWFRLSNIDEDDMLEHLELHLTELAEKLGQQEGVVGSAILRRRHAIATKLHNDNPELYEHLKHHRQELDTLLQRERKNAFDTMVELRKQYDELDDDITD